MANDGSIVSSSTSQLAGQPEVRQPQFWFGFTVVFGDAGWGSTRAWQRCAVDCSAEDSRARWFLSHSIFVAVVLSATVGALAVLLCVPMPVAAMLVDVMSSVVLPSIIDEALLDRRCFPTSRGWFLLDRHLPLVLG